MAAHHLEEFADILPTQTLAHVQFSSADSQKVDSGLDCSYYDKCKLLLRVHCSNHDQGHTSLDALLTALSF